MCERGKEREQCKEVKEREDEEMKWESEHEEFERKLLPSFATDFLQIRSRHALNWREKKLEERKLEER